MLLEPEKANQSDIWVTSAKWEGEHDHTLIVDCSDPRLPEAREDFCEEHLKVSRYDALFVPGGPAVLTLNEAFCFLERKRVKLLNNLHKIKRVIGLAHHDCAYYKLRYDGIKEEELRNKQCVDLINFRQEMQLLTSCVSVELYYAGPNENGFTAYTKVF